MRNLQRIAAICVVGVMWGTPSAFADPLPSATSPEVPRIVVESPLDAGATSVDAVTVDQYGFPTTDSAPKTTTEAEPAPTVAKPETPPETPVAKAAQSSLKPIRKMIGIINAPVQTASETVEMPVVDPTGHNPAPALDQGQQAIRQMLVQVLGGRVAWVGVACVRLAGLTRIIRLVGDRHRFAPSVLVVGPERPMNDADGWWGILTKLLGVCRT